MPALSQNFTFTVNSTSTAQIAYPVNTATGALVYTSNNLKGDGYFSNSDGFHTVQVNLTEFTGAVDIYGTLATEPTEGDWISIPLEAPGSLASNRYVMDTTGLISLAGSSPTSNINYSITATTISSTFNFVGNYVWLRAKISNWTGGAVTSIELNR
jgi:hypothetical protein